MRCYLDYNATAPLRSEARAAMLEAMDSLGNPSSVHTEGRAARGLLERARGDIAEAFGASPDEVIFTSGATEAAATALSGRNIYGSAIEHDSVYAWLSECIPPQPSGEVHVEQAENFALQLANSETGIVQSLPENLALSDITQAAGRMNFSFSWSGIRAAILSAHKFGGPKGVGCLLLKASEELPSFLRGGGQEMRRRAGTENVIGIAGMAAAAKAALADLAAGRWEEIAEHRDFLEQTLASELSSTIFIGKDMLRLPNTSAFALPGWRAETQVMMMDLEGFAISAGSACSSGKMQPSRVLSAMGFGSEIAASAIRVSLGLRTTREDITRFSKIWVNAAKRHLAKAA